MILTEDSIKNQKINFQANIQSFKNKSTNIVKPRLLSF